jgi:hypothetical protein
VDGKLRERNKSEMVEALRQCPEFIADQQAKKLRGFDEKPGFIALDTDNEYIPALKITKPKLRLGGKQMAEYVLAHYNEMKEGKDQKQLEILAKVQNEAQTKGRVNRKAIKWLYSNVKGIPKQ